MNAFLRGACTALFVVSPVFAAAPALACTDEKPPLHLRMESPLKQVGTAVGSGQFSYRFVVRDPQNIDRPYRNGRYQISLKGDAVFPDGSRFFRGKTDSRGRTATFRMDKALPESAWEVLPMSGQGEFGETFHLTTGECDDDLAGYPYMLNGELGPIFCGQALPGGLTIRYMMPMATSVQVYSSISPDQCRHLQRQINPVMARTSPAARIAGLTRLQRIPHWSDYQEMLQAKIDAQILHHGTLAQVRKLLERQVAANADTPQGKSSVYNNLAYDLIKQDPPRFLDYASQLLDESLRLDENVFNIDSKAWALHLAGKENEALQLMSRGLALYKARCTEAEKGSYPEALGHRGMVLWTQGKRSEALTDWAKADLSSSGGGWANHIPPWKEISPFITERAKELQAQGYKQEVCSEVVEEASESQ